MWNNTNPAELFSGTTWELIISGKYIQSGNTALQTGGSNSVSIAKANLPNVKLKVDSFSVTTQPHEHLPWIVSSSGSYNEVNGFGNSGNPAIGAEPNGTHEYKNTNSSNTNIIKLGGGQNTGTASPSTEVLGSGTAINIQPAYITLKFWKRLT